MILQVLANGKKCHQLWVLSSWAMDYEKWAGLGVRLDNGKTMEYEKGAGLGVRIDNGKTMENEKRVLLKAVYIVC